jgi:putative Mn2+ efflux pump MntP
VTLVEVFVLAFGLSMDATAVAGTRGLAASSVRARDALLVALFFGGFQALMPFIGSLLGSVVAERIAGWSHWIVFVVLSGIGAKMIYEARQEEPAERIGNPFAAKLLFPLAIATSVDALAAGVTLAVNRANVLVACSIIGLVTALLSFAGVYAGRRFGSALGRRLDVVGGLTLIGLGVKALVE